MAGPAVGTSNVGIRAIGSAIGEATNVNETSNLSLASILSGDSHGGIQNTFPSNDDSGPADTFNRIGGTNNPLQSTSLDNPGASIMNNLKTAPFHMSHTFGGQHADIGGGGGIGQLCIHDTIFVNTPDGMKSVYDLDNGDIIYSYNFETESIEEVPILDTLFVAHNNLIKVMYDDNDELKNIIVTRDHPIYLADGSMASYRPQRTKDLYDLDANQLEVGNSIQMIDGTKVIHRFEYMADKDTTYTILTKNNNFYAGGVLVHSEIGE